MCVYKHLRSLYLFVKKSVAGLFGFVSYLAFYFVIYATRRESAAELTVVIWAANPQHRFVFVAQTKTHTQSRWTIGKSRYTGRPSNAMLFLSCCIIFSVALPHTLIMNRYAMTKARIYCFRVIAIYTNSPAARLCPIYIWISASDAARWPDTLASLSVIPINEKRTRTCHKLAIDGQVRVIRTCDHFYCQLWTAKRIKTKRADGIWSIWVSERVNFIGIGGAINRCHKIIVSIHEWYVVKDVRAYWQWLYCGTDYCICIQCCNSE